MEEQEGESGCRASAREPKDTELSLRRQRLRWRARRGLLENDIVLEQFLAVHLEVLGEEEIAGLEQLLDCSDKDLFELIRGHGEPERGLDAPATRRVLAMLRET